MCLFIKCVVINDMAKQADLNQQLWRAVERGNEDTVRQLLNERLDPNYRN